MKEILQLLKTSGEQLDTEIATAVGLSIISTRSIIADMTIRGEIMSCQVTRFAKGKKFDGMSCRISGYISPAAPGRKSKKAQLKPS